MKDVVIRERLVGVINPSDGMVIVEFLGENEIGRQSEDDEMIQVFEQSLEEVEVKE